MTTSNLFPAFHIPERTQQCAATESHMWNGLEARQAFQAI
jgi:hypothetical protein